MDKGAEEMNEIGRKITDKIIEIHGSTDFTIVFLPYKRSMWDCMESVYEECIASGIDAHCVPIPFYRMKQHKEIDLEDYELSYFDSYAERTEILDTLKIDYAVIHYQYNGNNNVTRMLPEFYTEAIKERYHCEVIFIPYGIPFGGLSNKHHRIQPGIINCDYLFLNSEEEVKEFLSDWSEIGVKFDGHVWGYGSPKIDAVLKAKPNIPERWLKEIDGRPVTLVTNSLGPYLARPFERINRYREIIYAELDSCHAVIFRPHPLLDSTIKSMRPDTMAYFDNFLIDLSLEEHVIIDHYEYLEETIAISDKLFSDPSSIVEMWKATGKPYEVI